MENTDKSQKVDNKKDGEGKGFDWKNRNLWLSVVAVLIVVLVIVIVAKRKSGKMEDIDMPTDTTGWETLQQPEVPKPAGRRTKAKASNTTAINTVATLTYDQAVVKYKDARIQFDANCTAVPANVTFKSGAEFMLDNRAPVEQKFSLNGEFTIPAYGFKIMKLNSDTLPRQFLIDCGYRQNVATILLQK